ADEEMTVTAEDEARAEVDAPVGPGVGLEDLLDVREASALEAPADHRGRRPPVVAGLGVAQVDEAVLLEVRVDRDVQEPALAPGPDLGRTLDRLRIERAVTDDAQPARALGDEDLAARQERHPPGVLEPLDHGDDPERVLLGFMD